MAESIDIKIQNKDAQGRSVWTGYKNFADITNMSVSDLAPGSRNTFIQDGDRLEPRAGIAYFGEPGTEGDTIDPYWCVAHRIHSKYDNFISIQGITVPIRVYYSGTSEQGDVIEAWLPVDGDITNTQKSWFQITADVPDVPLLSTHRYYFDQWWDKDNFQSRTVFTMGNQKIWTWTGGFAPVVSKTATTITTTAGTTWSSKGFIEGPEGNQVVVVNGVEYTVTGGYGTDTIDVGSTVGISVGDLVFQSVDGNDTLGGKTTYDVCATLNNQVYYLDWKQRNEYISWNRNQEAYLTDTIFVGSGLNDAQYDGVYTGTVNGNYVVTIDSVNPESQEQEYEGTGPNTSTFDTSGYIGSSGKNRYKLVFIANMVMTFAGGVTPAYTVGEIIVGNTSNARMKVVDLSGIGAIYVEFISGTPQNGETYTGIASGVTSPALTSTIFQNGAFIYKNGNLVMGVDANQLPSGMLQFATTGNQFSNPSAIDGLQFATSQVGANNVGDYYLLTIDSGSPDTFSATLNGDPILSFEPITGSSQSIADGVDITFTNTTGHNLGDSWSMKAFYEVVRGWTLFTYTQPGRYPGEGFVQLLDSNGWALKPQEDKMYTNAQAGHYYETSLELSSDLLNETVKIRRLKSEPQNKVLFPYLLGYEKNQLAGISQDRTYDSLGRQELLELPQTKSISDEIRVDFETVDWEDGDFLYAMRKMFFVTPRNNLMFVWDDYKKYWHSPMDFAKRIGLISVIDGKLVGHSYEMNESYELFVGMNDLDEYPIHTRMVFPYDSFGKRFFQKASSAIGFEGYVKGDPQIFYRMNADVGGCSGQPEGQIMPVVCKPIDRASLGKSYLGYHGLGNDPVEEIDHFFFIDTFSKVNYYQRNMEVSCDSPDQRWALVSVGTNVDLSLETNTTIVHRKAV